MESSPRGGGQPTACTQLQRLGCKVRRQTGVCVFSLKILLGAQVLLVRTFCGLETALLLFVWPGMVAWMIDGYLNSKH